MTQTTMVRRSREAKKNASISVIAMRLAKEADDVQQKKAARFKKLFIAAKQAILRKYGPRAKVEWTKKQNNSQPTKQTKQTKKK